MFEDSLRLLIYLFKHFPVPSISISLVGSNDRTAPAFSTELFTRTPKSCFGTLGNTIAFPLQVIASCLFLDSCRNRSILLLIAVALAKITVSFAFRAPAFDYRVQF